MLMQASKNALDEYINQLSRVVDILVPNSILSDIAYIEDNIKGLIDDFEKLTSLSSKIWLHWENVAMSDLKDHIKNGFFFRFSNSFEFIFKRYRQCYNAEFFAEAKHKKALYHSTKLKQIIYGVDGMLRNHEAEFERFLNLYKIEIHIPHESRIANAPEINAYTMPLEIEPSEQISEGYFSNLIRVFKQNYLIEKDYYERIRLHRRPSEFKNEVLRELYNYLLHMQNRPEMRDIDYEKNASGYVPTVVMDIWRTDKRIKSLYNAVSRYCQKRNKEFNTIAIHIAEYRALNRLAAMINRDINKLSQPKIQINMNTHYQQKKSNQKPVGQEDLYKLVFNEDWTVVLRFLYSHKAKIFEDVMLQKAAAIFEDEFFRKIKTYPIERKDIQDNLDTLYVLNHGKFYTLKPDNYKMLIVELVKRKPLNEAANYAKEFPEEGLCKATIEQYIKQQTEINKEQPLLATSGTNWIEIYNRLFDLINDQSDPATYFSGPRFINVVREYRMYFPDYNQYIGIRNKDGKSTTRKIYYYDILLELEENIRREVIARILEIIRPFKTSQAEEIENILNGNLAKGIHPNTTENSGGVSKPVVFISYSWDSEEHKIWVKKLADRLCSDGIDVILDRYHLKPGKNLPYFVENSINQSERIIIIFTPNYKLKADNRAGGVGYEYSIMNAALYKNQTANEKIIPILRDGNMEASIPEFMQQFIHIDIRNNENFENSYNDLIREIYNEPAVRKPAIGNKPLFI